MSLLSRKRAKAEISKAPSGSKSDKPHVTVVMGHSFARRLGEYTTTSRQENMEFNPKERAVYFHGVSGSKLRDFQLQMPDVIQTHSPDLVILQVAGNDLTPESSSPSRVVELIKETTLLLLKLSVSTVIINRLFYRDVEKVQKNGRHPIRSDYNSVVDKVNEDLEKWCSRQHGIKFNKFINKDSKQRSLFHRKKWKKFLCYDGVHLSPGGMKRYYKYIRKNIKHVQ